MNRPAKNQNDFETSQRGATLIEAALFTVIAMGTIVGGIVFFQQASTSAKTNELIRSIATIQTQVRSLFQARGDFGKKELNTLLITSNAVPSNLMEDADSDGTLDTLTHGFGGTINVTGATREFTVALTLVPVNVCSRIISFDPLGNGIIGSGIVSLSDGTTTDTDGISPSEAATFCTTNATNGTVSLTWRFER